MTRGQILTLDYLDISVSISSLFPTIYGGIYGFNPSKQGLLYLPMLIGSIIGELITGPLGDRTVAGHPRNRVGRWVVKKNAKAGEANVEAAETEEEETVPEMRLLVGLAGTIFSVVSFCITSVRSSILIRCTGGSVVVWFKCCGTRSLDKPCSRYGCRCIRRPDAYFGLVSRTLTSRLVRSYLLAQFFVCCRLLSEVGKRSCDHHEFVPSCG
jgi:hypothetical protein